MTLTRLALQSFRHYRRTHAAVAFGVATAVAVVAGALLVELVAVDHRPSPAARR